MSEAKSGMSLSRDDDESDCRGAAPGFRFAHPGYEFESNEGRELQ
jgi:hypothetical protein